MCEKCAKKVVEILDQMGTGGEWEGLSKEQEEIERQTMGMRLRADIECPEEAAQPCKKCTKLVEEHSERAPTDGPSFSEELEQLINKHSMENNSDTPDFILARFMRSCQRAFDHATKERDNWYRKEKDPRQGAEHPQL